MGWTSCHNPFNTVDEFFRDQFTRTHDKDGNQIFFPQGKGVLKNIREYYLPVYKANEDRYFMFVALVDLKPKDGFDICYKDMDESMGPFYYNCPESLLKIVEQSPPRNEDAAEWRAKVRQRIDREKQLKVDLKEGAVVKFKEPLTFAKYGAVDTFRLAYRSTKSGRKTLALFSVLYGFCARIPNWKEREFQILA